MAHSLVDSQHRTKSPIAGLAVYRLTGESAEWVSGWGTPPPPPSADGLLQLRAGTADWLGHACECVVMPTAKSPPSRCVMNGKPTGWLASSLALPTGGIFGWREVRTQAALPRHCYSRGFFERQDDGFRWQSAPRLSPDVARRLQLPTVGPSYLVQLPLACRLAFLAGRLPRSGAPEPLARLSVDALRLIFARCAISSALLVADASGELRPRAPPRVLQSDDFLYVRDVELDDHSVGRLCYCVHKREPRGVAVLVTSEEDARAVVVEHAREAGAEQVAFAACLAKRWLAQSSAQSSAQSCAQSSAPGPGALGGTEGASQPAGVHRMSDLAAALPEVNPAAGTSLAELPDELLQSVLEALEAAPDLVAALQVSRRWRALVAAQACWRRIFCGMCPYPAAWAEHAPREGGYLRRCSRLGHLTRRLARVWTPEYRRQFSMGKYSRWVTGFEEAGFVLPLIFAARILGICLPAGFQQLDGQPEREYRPDASTCAHVGAGWEREKLAEHLDALAVGRDAYLGLHVFVDCEGYEGRGPLREGCEAVERHLATWWGGEQRASLLSRLFDAEAFLALAEFVLADVEEHELGGRIDSLFWDVHGLTVRGIEYVTAAGGWDEFPRSGTGGEPFSNARQLPPLFNLAKLTEHVEQLRAASVQREVPL
jgi:hypothetical protein